jgi:hypothetical protein
MELYVTNILASCWRWAKFVACVRGGEMPWTDLARDRDKWQAFVNSVINLLVSFLSIRHPVAFM